MLVLFATLGMTVVVFQQLVVGGGVTYYVPIAAAVLIVSLGSDYNIFAVGHIWEEARRRPLRDAIAIGSHTASRAITIAAVTLALSFGLLAIVPLRPFRELAFTMFVGVLIDAILVRSVMVPALVALFGTNSEWPSRRFWERRQPEAAPVAPAMGEARRS